MKSSVLVTKTVILGMLAEGQMHGYEIKKRLSRELGESADINFGSIYYGLKTFVARGWIDHIRDESIKGNPERSIYRITPSGRGQLKELLEAIIADTGDWLQPVEVGVNFMSHLSGKRAADLLRARYGEMKKRYDQALAEEAPQGETLPARLVREYRLYRLGAEVIWLRNLLPEL